MRIIIKESFLNRLREQIKYIALDSPSRARKFKSDLFSKINEIPKKPYAYRRSIYFDDTEIRDLIFKGYTIVFKIDKNEI